MLKRIYLEISNICNVNCSFCPIELRDQQVMSISDFEKTIAQAVPQAKEICLHLMGEPLAHPQFNEILKLCEKYQARIQLTTNGLLLERYSEQLLKSPALFQLNFSLQAFSDNFPHKNFNDYLSKILDFVETSFEIRPELYLNLRMWNQKSGQSNNEEIFSLVEQRFGVVLNRTIDVGSIKSKRVLNRLYLHFDSRFEWPSLDLPFQGDKGRCNGVLSHIGIHADGTVVPCCLDNEAVIKLGNCKKESLVDILANERTNAMREGFLRGELVEKLCQHCSYINRFKK